MFDFANSTGFSFIIIIINDETLIESIFYQTISSEHFLADKNVLSIVTSGVASVSFLFFVLRFYLFWRKISKKEKQWNFWLVHARR